MLDRAPAVFIPGIGSEASHNTHLETLDHPTAMSAIPPSQAEQLQTLKARIEALQVQLLQVEIKRLGERLAAATLAKEEGF